MNCPVSCNMVEECKMMSLMHKMGGAVMSIDIDDVAKDGGNR